MVLEVAKIILEGANIILKSLDDTILGVIPSQGTKASYDTVLHDLVYLKSETTYRDPNAKNWPLNFNSIVEPAGMTSRDILLQELADNFLNTPVPTAPTGSTDVFIQDQDTEVLGLFLANVLDTVSILTNTVKDSEEVDVETTGLVPVDGNFLCMQEDGKITQVEIASVTPIAGDQYTLGIKVPLDYTYTTAGGCSIQNVDMNVDGSITPKPYGVAPRGPYKWDITRLMVSMILDSAGDDGKFGNLTALANGVYFRKEDAASSQNLFNVRDNSDFRVEGYDVVYPTRSGGGGSFGMAARITFAGSDKRGVVVRLDGAALESFVANVRDKLEGIVKFRIKLQGHIVED